MFSPVTVLAVNTTMSNRLALNQIMEDEGNMRKDNQNCGSVVSRTQLNEETKVSERQIEASRLRDFSHQSLAITSESRESFGVCW